MKYIFCSLLIGFNIALAQQWWHRSTSLPQTVTSQKTSTPAIEEYHDWYLPTLGKAASAASVSQIKTRLSDWGLSDLAGSESLATPFLGQLARLELERWTELGLGRDGHANGLSIKHLASLSCIELKLNASGSSASLLPFCFHLLEMPERLGYLSDPVHISISENGDGLELDFTMRVFSVKQILNNVGQ